MKTVREGSPYISTVKDTPDILSILQNQFNILHCLIFNKLIHI